MDNTMSGMALPRDYESPKNAKMLEKGKAGGLAALHECMLQELRQPALGWYLGGIGNRQTRRAVGAVRRGAKAHSMVRTGARYAMFKRSVASDYQSRVVDNARSIKQRVASLYEKLKGKFQGRG